MPKAKTGRPRSCECGKCKKCKHAAYMREWWGKLTPEERREKTSRRDPQRVKAEYVRRERKRREDQRPEWVTHQNARKAVKLAIERGDLTRPETCEACGTKGRQFKDGRASIHAHHDDYSKPLKVRWLCADCHEAHHAKEDAQLDLNIAA